MKKITQNLRWLVMLLAMIVSVGAWAEKVVTITLSEQGYSNQEAVSSTTSGAVTLTYNQGESANAPAYYNTGSGVRVYAGGNLTVTANDKTMTKVVVTYGKDKSPTVTGTPDGWPQTITSPATWEGSATEVVLNVSDKGHIRIQKVEVTYVDGDTPTPTEPSITVDPATVNATAEGADGTLAISYENLNISSTADFGIQYYDTNNEEIDEPDWIGVEVESEEAGVSYMISYVVDANQGEARTAYCKVYAMDDEANLVYSDLITINQAAYVAPASDFATLPFAFDDGKNAIESTDGLTQEGLDSDYGSSPKLKFNGTGDWVLLQFDEVPGNLSFDIKGNTFSGGTFTVQTSEDGETYTDLATYTELGDTQTETFDNLSSDVRYIKWIYTEKVSGNVALGNIKLEKPSTAPSITVNPATVDATAEETEGTLALSYKNLNITNMEDFDIQYYDANNEEINEPDWIEVLVAEEEGGAGYVVSYFMFDNEGEARTAYCKVFALGDEDYVYSNLITINQAACVAPPTPTGVVYTKVASTADLVAGGEYIIVNEENSMAMSTTQNNNNRGATEITISENKATVNENTQVFTLEGSSDGWYFYTGSGYIYAASNSSNQLKTQDNKDDNAKATITISDEGTSVVFNRQNGRNTLQYNPNTSNGNPLFTCYASASQQPIQLYKKVVEEENITIGSAGYATYVTKKAIRFNENINAYAVLAIHETSVALDKLTEAPANTPIIVEGAEGEYPCTVIENAESPATNLLKVSTGVTGDGATFYALANKDQGVGFYPVGNGIEVPAGKAYLEIPPTMSVKGFLALGGLADAINNIAVENANGTIFNIAGQKVQNITKGGLYIVNGKKVFVK